MSAREDIFAAIRRNLPQRGQTPDAVAAAARALALEARSSRPDLLADDPVEAFAARIVSAKVVGASVDRIEGLEDLPAAIARYCEAYALERAIALQPDPELLGLDWSGFRLRPVIGSNETLGVARARWAIAETGTLVLHSGPASPTLLAFLPLHYVCVVEADRILAHLEDYVAAEGGAPPPRNVNLITGASGTADIEGAFVRGAHGPSFLHAVICTP